MYINSETGDWNKIFQNLGTSCTAILQTLMERHGCASPSLRDAGLLLAQAVLSNAIFGELPAGQCSIRDKFFIEKTLVNACCSQVDHQTKAYSDLSLELGKIHFIDHINLRLFRKILGIASAQLYDKNDIFLSDLLESIKLLSVPTQKLLFVTPPPLAQGGFDFSVALPPKKARIPTRKRNQPKPLMTP